MKRLSKFDKKAFEGDDLWQGQKDAEDFSSRAPGSYAYEPEKRGSFDMTDAANVAIWNHVEESFFKKGNRLSSVLAELKRLYPTLSQETINEIIDHVDYTLGQLKLQRESSEMGFMDSPVDLGKRPEGDFPSSSWIPSGQADQDVDPNLVEASLKKADQDPMIDRDQLFDAIEEYAEQYILNTFPGKTLDDADLAAKYEKLVYFLVDDLAMVDTFSELVATGEDGVVNAYKALERKPLENVEISTMPELDKKKYQDALLDSLSKETDPVKKDLIKKKLDRLKYAKQVLARKREAEVKKKVKLTDEVLKKQIPLFVDRPNASTNDHKCGTCKFRVSLKDGSSTCTIVDTKISLEDGTCNYWAEGNASKEADIRSSRMEPITAGYVEIPGKVNCGSCRHFKDRYCSLWDGMVGPSDCCMAWEGPLDKLARRIMAKEEILSDADQDEIARIAGPEYNIAFEKFYEAVKNRHPIDLAFDYAIVELSKMGITIDQTKFKDLIKRFLNLEFSSI